MDQKHIVIVTGCSGAGKSSVLHALEDNGYFCVDNIPLELIQSCVTAAPYDKHIALGVDIRTAAIEQCMRYIALLKSQLQQRLMLVFVSASTSVLIKRFQETRRKHPLMHGRTLTQAIKYEKQILAVLSGCADRHIITDELTIGRLRNVVAMLCKKTVEQGLSVTFMSFGFKYGIPLESNFVWDVRSLPNPYFISALRALSGKDKDIQEYLFAQQTVQDYWQRLSSFVQFAVAAAQQEGRSSITLAVGCTGGRHRSVAFTERLAACDFGQATQTILHRDIGRDTYNKGKA